MSDIIFKADGKETFRIPFPTPGTKCPKTKLEIKMTELITLNLTLDELKLIDKYVELNDDTQQLFDKIKSAYPQPKMHLENSGKFEVVSYSGNVYYRLEYPTDVIWYKRKKPVDGMMLVHIAGDETHRLLEGLWFNDVRKGKYPDEPYCPDEPEHYDEVEWDEKDNPKSKTIRDIIGRWWEDTFSIHSKWDAEECMDDLADQIEFWILRNKK